MIEYRTVISDCKFVELGLFILTNRMADKNRDTISYYGGNSADLRLNHW